MPVNVLLITTDQMRGDCIAALGHPDLSTPNLDAMARHGVAFTNAYSATPTCVPARAALFTGLSQFGHRRVGYQDCVPWTYSETLPGLFSAVGYHTHCAGKMHVWPPRALMGFHSVDLFDGFLPHRNTATPAGNWWGRVDDYTPWLRERVGYGAEIGDTGVGCNSWAVHPWPLPEHTHPTAWTVSKSLEFLRRRDTTKPFFLWTSFLAPHPPFLPLQSDLDEYLSRALRPPVLGDWEETAEPAVTEAHPDADCFAGRLSHRERHRMQAGYYAMIAHVDRQIGRLLRGLTDEGLLKNTVVLFTSDHGEMLGDHGMYRKSQPFQGSVSIPMVLYDPGDLLKLPQGTRCGRLVELRDVMPTLLEAAGVAAATPKSGDTPVPPRKSANFPAPELRGSSMLPLVREGQPGRCFLHGEHTDQQNGKRSAQYLVTETEKYIWYSDNGKELLFDLENDPGECRDLSDHPDWASRKAELRTILIRTLKDREEGYSDGISLRTGCAPKLLLTR